MQHMLNSLQQWIPSMRLLFKDSANDVLLCCSAEKSLYSLASIYECLKMLYGCSVTGNTVSILKVRNVTTLDYYRYNQQSCLHYN